MKPTHASEAHPDKERAVYINGVDVSQELFQEWVAEGRDPMLFPCIVPPTKEDKEEAREGWGG